MMSLIVRSVILVLAFLALAGCSKDGKVGSGGKTTEDDSKVEVAVSLASATDYYIGTMVGAEVAEAFRSAGAEVDILDGGNSVAVQIQQIQNAVVKGADIIYVFPIGGAEAYGEALKDARDAGAKVLVSNNNPGEGSYDAYVGSEEFYMGAMMAKMVTDWIDGNLPQADSVKALILEARYNETMARRCLGMRLVGQKFLRKADLESMHFIQEEGAPAKYKDEEGKLVSVREPTGGLILDKDGLAVLNPFYDSRVVLVETSNRVNAAVDPFEAQNALSVSVTGGNSDIQIVMAYGDVGLPVSQKVIDMAQAGTLDYDLDSLAVFCSDATSANMEGISQSRDNTTVLRGVMAAGNLVETLKDYAGKMVREEAVPPLTMEPLSYVMLGAGGEIRTVRYSEVTPISVDVKEFF